MVQDTAQIKENILRFLILHGPSLPVHMAGEIKSSILFTSAFLSELVSEKKVKMSNMRVGSSPVYFLPGQENALEKFSEHLKSKEKEAFILLKEKNFLRDSAQQPAIRVALREIRDFALPFKSQGEIIWRYFLSPESEYTPREPVKEEKPIKTEVKEIKKEVIEEEKPLDIFTKTKEKPKAEPKGKKIESRIKKPKAKQKEKFFGRIKEFLGEKAIELKDIENFTKNEIILRVIHNSQEKILVAFNKKKITDNDMIKAHKKALDSGLPYMLLGLSEPTKKTSDLVKAMKDLSSIHGLK